jgi:GrpB-like predicted nucleotidyltransferase (UPF0157 family)
MINLAPYDSTWAQQFNEQESLIRRALGDAALDVEHVGSTAVPGLSAKPIIDVNLTVPNSVDEAAYAPRLMDAGYELVHREPDWFEHRMFKGHNPEVNLHVFSKGAPELARMRAFCDQLRNNPTDRTLYERTKRNLAKQPWKTTQDYADAKTGVVKEILGHCALRAR